MVHTSQAHPSVVARRSSVKMNQKRDSIVSGRRGATNNSPQWSGRPTLLQKAVGSPVAVGCPPTIKSAPLSVVTRSKGTTKDIDTPVNESLNANITPRSSARKARADSASSTPSGTPTGTPNSSRPTSMIYSQGRDEGVYNIAGIKGMNMGRTARSPSISSDRSSSIFPHRSGSTERILHGPVTTSPETKPMFFRADDVRPGLSSIPSERFYEPEYMTGMARNGPNSNSGNSQGSTSTSPPVGGRPKFFHANGAVEATSSLPKLIPGKTSRPRSQILTVAEPPTSPQPRAPSPLKDEVLSRKSSLTKASPRRHTRLVSNSSISLEKDIRSPESLSFGMSNISRRSSLNTPSRPPNNYTRSPSVDTIGSPQIRQSKTPSNDNLIIQSPKFRPTVKPEFSQDVQSPKSILDTPQPQGPEKPLQGKSKLDQMNELAANARRERKVLDLEISNSSLLTINRTLEREMRKQNAELRRFRRLSRAGRISAAPSSRSASKKLSIFSGSEQQTNDGDDFSDQSSPSMSEEDEEDNEDGDENKSPRSLSPSSNPVSQFHNASIRAKDSKRLHLDLARHRALLVDSQKLNQSIKRCLGRTEDLIADGKKALEYRVRVENEQARGGRVLLPDELGEEEIGQGKGLLSPGISDRAAMNWGIDGESGEQKVHSTLVENLDDDGDYRAPNEEAAVDGEEEKVSPDENPNTDSDLRNEWDRIKADVQTPDEYIGSGSGAGVQGLKGYLSNLGPSWGF